MDTETNQENVEFYELKPGTIRFEGPINEDHKNVLDMIFIMEDSIRVVDMRYDVEFSLTKVLSGLYRPGDVNWLKDRLREISKLFLFYQFVDPSTKDRVYAQSCFFETLIFGEDRCRIIFSPLATSLIYAGLYTPFVDGHTIIYDGSTVVSSN